MRTPELTLSDSSVSYYTEGNLAFQALIGSRGVVLNMDIHAPVGVIVSEFDQNDELSRTTGEKIRELYDSLEVHEVTLPGGDVKTIEAGIIRGQGDRSVLHGGTYSSSLSTNKGNGYEEAREAALDPTKTRIYIGAPGIGGTSPLTAQERRYLREHGSLMAIDLADNNVTALPHVQAVGEVVRRLGVEVTDLHSDSAGALVTTAYGAAYGAGNILSAHQNVRPGVKDIGWATLAYGMLYVDGVTSKKHADVSPDVLKMGAEKVALVEENLSEEFRARDLKLSKSGLTLLANLVGLGRGPKHGDPLVTENIALVRANPEARVLLTVGSEDPLSRATNLAARLDEIVSAVSTHTHAPVSAVIFDGMSHNIQTHYPQQLRDVARFLLP